jgi:putative secretion ATPase (PEP-CTERM system associated)
MYEAYYGLRANPFRLAPDPQFFYESTCHKRGLAYLRYGLHQGQGFVVVTGVPGTGKSLLVQTIFAELAAGQRMVLSSINNTNLEADDVLRAVSNSFDVYCGDSSKAALLNALENFLIEKNRQGKRVLLIVDEAQNLPKRALEELRMLSNFQRGDQPLMQIMLLGQQQLQSILADPAMEQLTQRVIASCHLYPLDSTEIRSYIEHRLRHVGWRGKPSFSGEALALIGHITRGIPRLINTFCDRLLLAAYLDEKQQIDTTHVRGVLQELQNEVTGSWQGIDLGAAPATVLAALPDGEFLPGDETATAVAETRVTETETSVATAPLGVSKGGLHAAEGVSTVVPIVRVSRPLASGRVGLSVQQVTALLYEEAREEIKEEPEYALATDDGVTSAPVPESRHEPVADDGAASSAAPLAVAAPVAEDQPPSERLYKGQDAMVARRWWLAIGVVALVVMAVLLFMMFAGGDRMVRWGSSLQLPLQNQGEVAQPTPFIPATGTEAVVVDTTAEVAAASESEPFSDSTGSAVAEPEVVAPPAIAPPPAPAIPATVLVVKPAAPPAAKTGGRPAPVEPAKPVVVTEPQAVLKPAPEADVVIEVPPPALRAPAPAAEPSKSQVDAALAVAAAKPSIADVELPDLLNSFVFAYESGDLRRLVELFADNAVADESVGRNRIARDYRELFQATDMRRMNIGAIKWHSEGMTAQGSGEFEVTVWRRGEDNSSTIHGKLAIEVVKTERELVIRKLTHVVSR